MSLSKPRILVLFIHQTKLLENCIRELFVWNYSRMGTVYCNGRQLASCRPDPACSLFPNGSR